MEYGVDGALFRERNPRVGETSFLVTVMPVGRLQVLPDFVVILCYRENAHIHLLHQKPLDPKTKAAQGPEVWQGDAARAGRVAEDDASRVFKRACDGGALEE